MGDVEEPPAAARGRRAAGRTTAARGDTFVATGAGFGGSREEDVSGDSDDDCPGGESEYAGDDDAEVEVENVGDRTLTLLERERREDLVLAAAVEVFRCCTRDCLRFKLRRVCVRSSASGTFWRSTAPVSTLASRTQPRPFDSRSHTTPSSPFNVRSMRHTALVETASGRSVAVRCGPSRSRIEAPDTLRYATGFDDDVEGDDRGGAGWLGRKLLRRAPRMTQQIEQLEFKIKKHDMYT